MRRTDGGCNWPDQDRSHLTPTFAAIACYPIIGREPPDKSSLAEYVRTHHPFRIKKLERDLKVFEYEQIQSLLWLGEDASSFSEQVRSWGKPFIESTVAVCQYSGEKRILHANTSFFLCSMRHGVANLPGSY